MVLANAGISLDTSSAFTTCFIRDNDIAHAKMVYLTMTPTIVEALQKLHGRGIHEHDELEPSPKESVQPGKNAKQSMEDEKNTGERSGDIDLETQHFPEETQSPSSTTTSTTGGDKMGNELKTTEPLLSAPAIGNPISHGQIIDLARDMKARELQPYQLETLLKGSTVYIPLPPPKPEPVGLHLSCNHCGPF